MLLNLCRFLTKEMFLRGNIFALVMCICGGGAGYVFVSVFILHCIIS